MISREQFAFENFSRAAPFILIDAEQAHVQIVIEHTIPSVDVRAADSFLNEAEPLVQRNYPFIEGKDLAVELENAQLAEDVIKELELQGRSDPMALGLNVDVVSPIGSLVGLRYSVETDSTDDLVIKQHSKEVGRGVMHKPLDPPEMFGLRNFVRRVHVVANRSLIADRQDMQLGCAIHADEGFESERFDYVHQSHDVPFFVRTQSMP